MIMYFRGISETISNKKIKFRQPFNLILIGSLGKNPVRNENRKELISLSHYRFNFKEFHSIALIIKIPELLTIIQK